VVFAYPATHEIVAALEQAAPVYTYPDAHELQDDDVPAAVAAVQVLEVHCVQAEAVPPDAV